MKHVRSLLFLFLGLIAILCSLTVWIVYREQRQDRINRDLIAAIKRNDTQAVVSLLHQGADANCRDEPYKPLPWWKLLRNRLRGVKPPTSETALLLAASDSDYADWDRSNANKAQIIKALLRAGADSDVRESGDGATAMMKAAFETNAQAVHELLSHGARVDAKNNSGETALWVATERGDLANSTGREIMMVRDLLAYGANVNLKNRAGITIFEFMKELERPDPEIVQLLEQHRVQSHRDIPNRKKHRPEQP